jgi:hypothetical protein
MAELCCYAAPVAIGIASKSPDQHRVFQHPQAKPLIELEFDPASGNGSQSSNHSWPLSDFGERVIADRDDLVTRVRSGAAASILVRQRKARKRNTDLLPIMRRIQSEGGTSLNAISAKLTERGIKHREAVAGIPIPCAASFNFQATCEHCQTNSARRSMLKDVLCGGASMELSYPMYIMRRET